MRETYKIILVALIILILSQAFMIGLASNSFEKIHVASELTRYAVPQKDFKRKIEAALRFGKPLDKLLGMDRLLDECAKNCAYLRNIVVYGPTDQPLYTVRPLGLAPRFPVTIGRAIEVPDEVVQAVEVDDGYILTVPLLGPGETWLGSTASSLLSGHVVFVYGKEGIAVGVDAFWKKRVLIGSAIVAASSLLLFVLLVRVRGGHVAMVRKKIFVRVLGATILAQVAFAGVNVWQFHLEHVQVVHERVQAQLELLRNEVKRVTAQGVSLDRVSRLDEFLAEILRSNPEVQGLRIDQGENEVLAHAQKNASQSIESSFFGGPALTVTVPLVEGGQTVLAGYARADLDRDTLLRMLQRILLDSLTVALIASLFIVEQIFFFISRVGRTQEPLVESAADGQAVQDRAALDTLMLARFAAFLFLFAFALPVSFVPLYMRDMYQPLWGLPRNVVLGLPISLEMLCALFSSLAAGTLADKSDWRWPFVCGLLVTAAGLYYCAIVDSGVNLILARGVCGLGYGLSWMALQSFLVTHATPTTRARGSSHFVAGIFSGHICGTALGAMLAERFGYAPVFALGAGMALAVLVFFALFMRQNAGQPHAAPKSVAVPRFRGLWQYLSDRTVLSLIVCCVVPFSVCQVGLLFFATPLYLDQLGFAKSDIGRVLMMYGLSVVYLAPQLSKFVDKKEHKKPFIVVGGLLGGAGLSLLFVVQGFWAVLAAIFLLGLASSIGSSAQTALVLKQQSTSRLGFGKAMAIQRATDKLGQMLGPLALGALMSSVDIALGLVFLGVGYMALTVIFMLVAREESPAPEPWP